MAYLPFKQVGRTVSYREISLLSAAGKVLARVLLPRRQVIREKVLPESQCGFRSSRSTIDVVFALRQLQEKCIEQQHPLYVAFIDLIKAFNLVSSSVLLAILRRFGFFLINIILKLHDDMHAIVQDDGSRCHFSIKCGVKQGYYVHAPTLFVIFLTTLLSAHTCISATVWSITALSHLWEICLTFPIFVQSRK